MATVTDNEAVYDSLISPLMAQIIGLCKEHGIPMAATFEYAPSDFCTSLVPAEGSCAEFLEISKAIERHAGLRSYGPLFQITTTKPDGSRILEVILP